MSLTLEDLQKQLLDFATERDWEQFHSPKNLSMALAIEASELMEHFQWLTEEQSRKLPEDTAKEVALELADVFMYCLLLAGRLQVDLPQVAQEKIRINREHYPVEKAKGKATKYTKL